MYTHSKLLYYHIGSAKTSTKSDEDISRKVEEFAAFVGSKKATLKAQYQRFQQGVSMSPITPQGDDGGTTALSRLDGVKRYIDHGVSQVARNLPSDPKSPSSSASSSIDSTKLGSATEADKNIEKIDNYLGSKVEEMGTSLMASMKDRLGNLFASGSSKSPSSDSSSQSNQTNESGNNVVAKNGSTKDESK